VPVTSNSQREDARTADPRDARRIPARPEPAADPAGHLLSRADGSTSAPEPSPSVAAAIARAGVEDAQLAASLRALGNTISAGWLAKDRPRPARRQWREEE